MSDPRLITDEELAAFEKWMRGGAAVTEAWRAARAILARNPAPWEPSEDDITAYCEAWGWSRYFGDLARNALIYARKRGLDAVPRRIEGES